MWKHADRFFCWFIGCDRCARCGKLIITTKDNCIYCLVQNDMTDEELLQEFDKYIVSNADTVDPDDKYDWYALAYGYFLGKGKQPADALALVTKFGRKRGLR